MLFNGVPANIMALAGLVFAFIMTCLLLVKCNDRLPKDQGREFAVNGALSAGKPRGAGFIFILVFIVSVVLFCELNTEIIIYLVLLAAAMMTGFLDDCSRAPWGELKKGLLDFAIAVMVAITFLNFNSNVVEFAIFGGSITIPPVIFGILTVVLVWVSINVTNCSDGVDGLSGTLTIITLISLYMVDQIKGMDLFLYNRMEGTIWGCDGEFISAPRLDDLQCAFTSTMALLNSESDRCIPVVAVFDNEEVGSGTKQGAGSTFLYDILRRINRSLGRTEEEYLTSLASSFMVSADNGHAVHPNYADKTDPTNRTYLNGGLVIKHSANQKYTTDAVSAAVMRCLCERAGVPYQEFLNRSDILGGSTLGNISNAQVSLNTVDIGLPQLAMHSPYETAGSKDMAYMEKAFEEFFKSAIRAEGDGTLVLE